jgi:hypothetical protein
VADQSMPKVDEIESLKKTLLDYTDKIEIHDPSVDIISSAEVYASNSCKELLAKDLRKLFKILDKLKDKDDVRSIYNALDDVVRWAVLVGNFNPSNEIKEHRRERREAAIRDKRTANIAAKKRRDKMRPFVEEVAKEISTATQAYKTLMKRPEFVTALDRNTNPRQIKADIGAVLMELDVEADFAERWRGFF